MLTKSINSVLKSGRSQMTPYARTLFSNGNNPHFGNTFTIEVPRVAYVEDHSKHRMRVPLYDLEPRTENSWIAPNATLGK